MKLRLDPNSTQPLHQQAEELLRTMIQQEEYKKGKLMPNEVELSKELNISRNTLRQAGKHGKIDPVGTDEIDPVKTA